MSCGVKYLVVVEWTVFGLGYRWLWRWFLGQCEEFPDSVTICHGAKLGFWDGFGTLLGRLDDDELIPELCILLFPKTGYPNMRQSQVRFILPVFSVLGCRSRQDES